MVKKRGFAGIAAALISCNNKQDCSWTAWASQYWQGRRQHANTSSGKEGFELATDGI